MKVTISEYGGLAPGIRRLPQTIDTSSLSMESASELSKLIAAASKPPTGSENSQDRGRDAVSYAVRVEEDDKSDEIRQSDTAMTPAFAALLEWFDKHRDSK